MMLLRLGLLASVWRHMSWVVLGVIFFLLAVIVGDAYAQSFDFRDVCGGDVGPGESILSKCGYDTNFLQASVQPFEMVTGGFLSLIFWGVVTICVYLKYRNSMLALLVGVPVLMVGAIALPQTAETFIVLMAAAAVSVTIFILIWKIPRD